MKDFTEHTFAGCDIQCSKINFLLSKQLYQNSILHVKPGSIFSSTVRSYILYRWLLLMWYELINFCYCHNMNCMKALCMEAEKINKIPLVSWHTSAIICLALEFVASIPESSYHRNMYQLSWDAMSWLLTSCPPNLYI